jgi:hypothetical protein
LTRQSDPVVAIRQKRLAKRGPKIVCPDAPLTSASQVYELVVNIRAGSLETETNGPVRAGLELTTQNKRTTDRSIEADHADIKSSIRTIAADLRRRHKFTASSPTPSPGGGAEIRRRQEIPGSRWRG